jgi:hypothetical protein
LKDGIISGKPDSLVYNYQEGFDAAIGGLDQPSLSCIFNRLSLPYTILTQIPEAFMPNIFYKWTMKEDMCHRFFLYFA